MYEQMVSWAFDISWVSSYIAQYSEIALQNVKPFGVSSLAASPHESLQNGNW